MSSGDCNIQELINDCDTLSGIGELLEKNTSNNYEIHKKFDHLSSCFNIKVSNIDDVRNSDILGKNLFNDKDIPIDEMKTLLSNLPKINFEISRYIPFIIDDDTEKLSDEDKIYLADKYSSFLQFVIDKFSNVRELNVTNGFNNKPDKFFLFLIYEKIKSNTIKMIGPIYFDEILEYEEKYSLSEHDVFGGFSELEEINVSIRSSEYLNNLSDTSDVIKNFFDYTNKFKDIRLVVSFSEDDENCVNNALKILNYGKSINLNIQMDPSMDWNKYFDGNNYEFNDKMINVKDTTKSVVHFIKEIKDFEILKRLLHSLENLESITFDVDSSITKTIFDECKTLDEAKVYINELFNYRSNLKKLVKAKVSFGKFHTTQDDPNNEIITNLYNYMAECMISILPSSISKYLYLMEMDNMTIQFFEKISILFPSLKTISFLLCHNIPEDALFKLPSVRNVVFNGERKVNIPPWIETVMFLYFDIDYYYPDDVVSENKKNEHYFDLMNNKFNISLRCVKEDEIYYIAFLKNFDKWKDLDTFMNDGY